MYVDLFEVSGKYDYYYQVYLMKLCYDELQHKLLLYLVLCMDNDMEHIIMNLELCTILPAPKGQPNRAGLLRGCDEG